MKKILFSLLALLIAGSTYAKTDKSGYPITPVPFTAVKVAPNSFWGQRLQASRDVTIPLAFSKCETEHRYDNFLQAAEHIKDSNKTFQVTMGFPFDDTDPYKTLEGAAYLMQTHPNAIINGEPIDQYCDRVIGIIASAQEPDGYLYTARTQNPEKPHSWSGAKRWVSVEDGSHELYNLGHLCEAAVAHYNATGKRNLLDIAIRFADCVCREIGPKSGQANVVPGHQIAEMGLAKLYIATGDRKYLEQAKYFLDQRGTVNPAWQDIGNGGYRDADGYIHRTNQYSQSYKPVTEQAEAVGHAVRAGYMYAGMADVAALTGDASYIQAIDRIWGNIVGKKYYLTGGVGATGDGERFGDDYELPNLTAYCETCAAIAQVYLFYRLFLLHGESKYYDVLERTLYNGVISGISIDGGRFFYPNPLESNGGYERQPWFGCACCPSNAARFIPSLPQYIYAVKDKSFYINLFVSNETTVKVGGKVVSLKQETNYPWEGDVTLRIEKNKAGKFALKIRIPGWVRNKVVPSDLYKYADGKQTNYSITVSVNSNRTPIFPEISDDGYCTIVRKWKEGDEVQLHFDMEPRLVQANEQVEADRGRVAIERGPLVYCAEWPDNTGDVLEAKIEGRPSYTLGKKEIAQTDVVTISTQGLTLIPYYAWAHRGKGHMAIWFPTASAK
jgi:hypothetical protein